MGTRQTPLPLDGLAFRGGGLVRPECVLAHRSGLLFASDWQGLGGVSVVRPDGSCARITAADPPRPMRPNGIALEPGGTFLLADLGTEEGGVWRLHPDGGVEPVVTEAEGRSLPPTNYVHIDGDGRVWITVSTSMRPRDRAYRRDVADGFVVLAGPGGARIVAEGLGYTNECQVDPAGAFLYVNETFARRLSRFPILAGGRLGDREMVATFGPGTFPDGLVFDAEGGVWITSIVSNRVIRIGPGGRQTIVLEDADPAHLAWVEEAYQGPGMGRPHLDRVAGRRLRNISSLAFGGPDLTTAFLGCLAGDGIASFTSDVPGAAPPHWSAPLDALLRTLASAPSAPAATNEEPT